MNKKNAESINESLKRERDALASNIRNSSSEQGTKFHVVDPQIEHYKSRISELEEKGKLAAEYEHKLLEKIGYLEEEIHEMSENNKLDQKSSRQEILNLKEEIERIENTHKKELNNLRNEVQRSKNEQQSMNYRELGASF